MDDYVIDNYIHNDYLLGFFSQGINIKDSMKEIKTETYFDKNEINRNKNINNSKNNINDSAKEGKNNVE